MSINILAVILAAVASMVVGFVWYSMPVMGKHWLNAMGKKASDFDKESANVGYAMAMVGALVMSFVMAVLVNMTNTTGVVNGALLGLIGWAGFVFPSFMSNTVFEAKPWKLFLIDVGNYLVTFIVVGAIIGMWR